MYLSMTYVGNGELATALLKHIHLEIITCVLCGGIHLEIITCVLCGGIHLEIIMCVLCGGIHLEIITRVCQSPIPKCHPPHKHTHTRLLWNSTNWSVPFFYIN